MQTVESDMKQASAQIDAANASLNDVITTGSSGAAQPAYVKKSFDTYSENVKKMERIAKGMNKNIDQMNSRGNAYFEEWGKEGSTLRTRRYRNSARRSVSGLLAPSTK